MAQERLGHDRWRFTLGNQPPTGDERVLLLPDLRALDLDDTLLDLWGGATAAGPDADAARTKVLLLRAYHHDELAGLTAVLECHVLGSRYVDPGPLGRGLDSLRLTLWFWDRTSAGVDGHSGPGLVAHAVDREIFADAAVRWLSRRYRLGVLVEPLGAPAGRRDVVTSFAPTAVLRPGADGDRDVDGAPELALEVAAYAGAGGRVEVTAGPVPAERLAQLTTLLAQAVPVRSPVRGPVAGATATVWRMPTARHVLAVRQGRVDGFWSLLHSGRQLLFVAGAVGAAGAPAARVRASLLVATARLARELGCPVVQLGSAVAPGDEVLTVLSPARLRFVSRWAPVRTAVRGLVPRSRVSPESFPLAATALRVRTAPVDAPD